MSHSGLGFGFRVEGLGFRFFLVGLKQIAEEYP